MEASDWLLVRYRAAQKREVSKNIFFTIVRIAAFTIVRHFFPFSSQTQKNCDLTTKTSAGWRDSHLCHPIFHQSSIHSFDSAPPPLLHSVCKCVWCDEESVAVTIKSSPRLFWPQAAKELIKSAAHLMCGSRSDGAICNTRSHPGGGVKCWCMLLPATKCNQSYSSSKCVWTWALFRCRWFAAWGFFSRSYHDCSGGWYTMDHKWGTKYINDGQLNV